MFVASTSSLVSLLIGDWRILDLLPLLSLPLDFVGLCDDRFYLPSSLRFGFQVLTACLIIPLSPLTHSLGLDLAAVIWTRLAVLVLLIVAVAAIINFTNFMDGIDGLVAGCMAVAITAMLIALTASWPLWALVGSLLGFLFWNWSPAKVFMGDVGSTFLGAVFAGLVLQASSWLEALGYLLVATPLLADAFLCVFRRLLAGQRVFQAHRLHLFQRLHQAGWPHARVSLTYLLSTAVLAAAMLAGGLPLVSGFAAVLLLIGFWLDQRVAVPFSLVSES